MSYYFMYWYVLYFYLPGSEPAKKCGQPTRYTRITNQYQSTWFLALLWGRLPAADTPESSGLTVCRGPATYNFSSIDTYWTHRFSHLWKVQSPNLSVIEPLNSRHETCRVLYPRRETFEHHQVLQVIKLYQILISHLKILREGENDSQQCMFFDIENKTSWDQDGPCEGCCQLTTVRKTQPQQKSQLLVEVQLPQFPRGFSYMFSCSCSTLARARRTRKTNQSLAPCFEGCWLAYPKTSQRSQLAVEHLPCWTTVSFNAIKYPPIILRHTHKK